MILMLLVLGMLFVLYKNKNIIKRLKDKKIEFKLTSQEKNIFLFPVKMKS